MVDPNTDIKFKGGGEAAYRPDKVRKSRPSQQEFQKVTGRDKEKGEGENPEEKMVREKFASVKNSSKETPAVRDTKKEGVSLFDLSRESTKETSKTEPKSTAPVPFDVQQRLVETGAVESPKPLEGPSRLHEIVQKIVEKLTVMTASDKNETTITIKNNAMFEGTRVVITEFNTAKGEFNLSFENLTQRGKDLLDSNLNPLKMGLEQKGYVVHIITTTTLDEAREIASSPMRNPKEREQNPDQQNDQQDESQE